MTYDRIFADRFFAGKSEEKSAVFIFSQVNRRFFTGYGATDGAVLITDKRSIFLTDFRY
ncbi:MAG: aminopeptidase P family N-terminal domain-containing protein, partial [Clostridia bacterium]|nr:aminopeptidase P family N-terminal domain-containing protein [Clostridia bacterium]